MNTNVRWSSGELVPLADRLRYMFVVRVALIVGIGVTRAAAPGLLGPLPTETTGLLGVWAVGTVTAEILWRVWRRRGLPLFGATLILDGVVLVYLSEVGSVTNVRYLIFLHLVAVVLLASYRTGLKMLLWFTLLLFTVFFAGQDRALGLTPVVPGTSSRWDLGQLGVFVSVIWGVAVATAAFSSVNERELRRRRFDLEVLAQFGVALEGATDRQTVAGAVLDTLADAFPVGRLLLVTPGRQTVVLGQRGVSLSEGTAASLDPSSVILRAQRSRQTMLLSEFHPETDAWLTSVLPKGRNFMVVPLNAEGGSVGVLLAEHTARGGSRVERRLVAIIERFASHTALALRNAALLEQMERMANTDGLTHIANHRTFQANLAKEMARSIRTGQPVGLVMLDIDNFKLLNDTHGHPVGDEVLRQVAQVLRASCREFDTIARYGGEEFAVIMPGCGPQEATATAVRLHRLVGEGVKNAHITVSAGAASSPSHAHTAEELVKAADDALYQAKRAGRDRVFGAGIVGEQLYLPTRTA